MSLLLSIQNLTFGWLEKPLFKNVSLNLPHGTLVVLKGENGTGKTTLLQLITGMIPHFSRGRLLQGDIVIKGRSILKESPKSFFPAIAYVPNKHIDFFLFTENLTDEILFTRGILNLTEAIVSTKLQQFGSFFPDFRSFMKLPFLKISNYQKTLSLLFIYYLQDATLFLLDEVIPDSHPKDNWFHFLTTQTKRGCSAILINHQIEESPFSIWEIKNHKILC